MDGTLYPNPVPSRLTTPSIYNNYNHLLLSKGMILKLSICRVHMNLFYLLKTPIYADGVTNGAINIDTKEKPVSIILPQKLIGLNIHVK